MIRNDRNINVVTKNNIVNTMTKLHSIDSEFTLEDITITDLYCIGHTFR